jgi:hypothetical protein
VSWLLNSDRVKECISRTRSNSPARGPAPSIDIISLIRTALVQSEGSRPLLGDFNRNLSQEKCSIEIPRDINSLKDGDPKLGTEWREATRAAFLAALDAGFLVEDFVRVEIGSGSRWFYKLRK